MRLFDLGRALQVVELRGRAVRLESAAVVMFEQRLHVRHIQVELVGRRDVGRVAILVLPLDTHPTDPVIAIT